MPEYIWQTAPTQEQYIWQSRCMGFQPDCFQINAFQQLSNQLMWQVAGTTPNYEWEEAATTPQYIWQ